MGPSNKGPSKGADGLFLLPFFPTPPVNFTRSCFKTPAVHSKASKISKESLDLTIPSLGELGVKYVLKWVLVFRTMLLPTIQLAVLGELSVLAFHN